MYQGSSSPFPHEFVSEIPPNPTRNCKWRWMYDMIAALNPGQILRLTFPDSETAVRAKAAAVNCSYRQGVSIPVGYRLRVASRENSDGSGVSIYVHLKEKPLPAGNPA